MRRLLTCFACLACALVGGDWLSSGGDAQHSGWQRRGKSIKPENAGELKLLWKLALDNQSREQNSLTAPTMLGPIVTHRGVKELVFIGGASDNLYAVDADRGRIFWKRHVETEPAARPCGAGLTATPVLAPPAPGTQKREDDDEGTTPMRPFYFVASDGILHTIRPADGVDMTPARKFVPPQANVSALNLFGRFIYAGTAAGCGVEDGVWGIDTGAPEAKAAYFAGKNAGVSVGFHGTVYATSVALNADTLEKKWSFPVSAGLGAPIPFEWNGRELLATAGAGGGLLLLENGKVLARADAPEIRGLASWLDSHGTRWIYAASAGKVEAYRVAEQRGMFTIARAWSSREMASPAAPAIVNGVVFALARGDRNTRAVLFALDANTGAPLYSSGEAIGSHVDSSGLGVANGHICFGTADNVLYCFGFPIEI